MNATRATVTAPLPTVSGYTPEWGNPYGFWKSLGIAFAVFVLVHYFAWILNPLVQILVLPQELPDSGPSFTTQSEMALFRTGLLVGIVGCIRDALGIVLLGFIVLQSDAPARTYFGVGRLRIRQCAVYLIVIAFFFLGRVGFNRLFAESLDTDFWTNLYRSSHPEFPLWLAVGLIGPLFEELLYRGFLFTTMRQTRLGLKGTVVVTSILFAATHYRYGVIGVIWVFLVGLLLGVARHRSDTTSLPFLMHASLNLLNLTSWAIIA